MPPLLRTQGDGLGGLCLMFTGSFNGIWYSSAFFTWHIPILGIFLGNVSGYSVLKGSCSFPKFCNSLGCHACSRKSLNALTYGEWWSCGILRFILRQGQGSGGEWADFEFWILSLGIHDLPLGTNYDLTLRLMNILLFIICK